MLTTHIAVVRDHSMSMSHLRKGAFEDYNRTLEKIQTNARVMGIPTTLTVVKCGVPSTLYARSATVGVEVKMANAATVMPMPSPANYDTLGGSTPLFDSVGRAIQILQERA